MHRPDFISRSGERVKHLKLVMEERRIQSVLQSEREELFNPPEKRKGYRNASHMLSDRGTFVVLLLVFYRNELIYPLFLRMFVFLIKVLHFFFYVICKYPKRSRMDVTECFVISRLVHCALILKLSI